MARVKTNGIELAVRVWPGSGSTVIGVHGLTAVHACWYPLADTVAPAHRFVAYDLRGRGDSDKRSPRPAVGRLGIEFPSLEAFLGLMTEDEAEALVRAIPHCRLVVVPGTNHYTVLIGDQPIVRKELAAFLEAGV